MIEEEWLSAHLFYMGNYNTFLPNVLSPVITQLIDKELISQYFFIRYFEGGPHVRLRIKGTKENLYGKVKEFIYDYFCDYFAKYPSVSSGNRSENYYSNNTLEWIKYEPEITRYGGLTAMKVAEKQFQYSSASVIGFLSQKADPEYAEILGTAIQMHLGFANKAGLSIKQMQEFFHDIYTQWLPTVYYLYRESSDNISKAVTDQLQQNYQHTKHQTIPFIKNILMQLASGELFEDDWFNNWLESSGIIHAEILKIQAEDKLHIVPDHFLKSEMLFTDEEIQQRCNIYVSYVHMLNNRLGLQNQDEVYIAYLISHTLLEIYGR